MVRIIGLLLISVSLFSCQDENEVPSKYFLHGVASGDPMEDRVIIWSRITKENTDKKLVVNWEVSGDKEFESVIASGVTSTSGDQDYTIKIDVEGLKPSNLYYYRFEHENDRSATGVTKTASIDSDSLQFAVVSCSNYEWGYFNVYARIADRPTLDAVIHLGDYIYEHGPGTYGDTTIQRLHEPAKEIITLSDYRGRYAQYRGDKDLQAAHQKHPFITIWDDHEIANDAYADGARNHQSDEGLYNNRKAAAAQAYYEWMPIRENKNHYRKFSFGKLAELYMLDERLEGRTEPVKSIDQENYADTARHMISSVQREWLFDNLKSSKAQWKILGNQVLFTDLNQAAVFPDRPKNLDSWDGYPADKNRIASFFANNNIKNILFLTGDTHSSWAFEVLVKEISRTPIAAEFGTPSISSSNYDESSTLDSAKMAQSLFTNLNPHTKYNNLIDHGYMLLTVEKSKSTVRFYYVDTVKEPSQIERLGGKMWVNNGTPFIKQFSLYE